MTEPDPNPAERFAAPIMTYVGVSLLASLIWVAMAEGEVIAVLLMPILQWVYVLPLLIWAMITRRRHWAIVWSIGAGLTTLLAFGGCAMLMAFGGNFGG